MGGVWNDKCQRLRSIRLPFHFHNKLPFDFFSEPNLVYSSIYKMILKTIFKSMLGFSLSNSEGQWYPLWKKESTVRYFRSIHYNLLLS